MSSNIIPFIPENIPIQPLPLDKCRDFCTVEVGSKPINIIKELIENSIDAGATAITIIIESGGFGGIKVIDDGCGIPAESLQYLTRYYTSSKVVPDVPATALKTFGFHGTSLAHISELATLIVSTKVREDQFRSINTYSNCTLINSRVNEVKDFSSGTTVELVYLYANYPEMREYRSLGYEMSRKLLNLISRYSLLYSHIQFMLSNSIGKKEKISTPIYSSINQILSYFNDCEDISCFSPFELEPVDGMQWWALIGNAIKPPQRFALYHVSLNGRIVKHKQFKQMFDQIYLERFKKKPAIQILLAVFIYIPPEKLTISGQLAKQEITIPNANKAYDIFKQALDNEFNRQQQQMPIPPESYEKLYQFIRTTSRLIKPTLNRLKAQLPQPIVPKPAQSTSTPTQNTAPPPKQMLAGLDMLLISQPTQANNNTNQKPKTAHAIRKVTVPPVPATKVYTSQQSSN